MRKVSQSYFDETVKSNMELFDLSVDEAIAESVQTFELEGVDLSDIVKDMIKYENGHPSVLAIKRLQTFLEVDHETPQLLETLQSIQLPRNSDFAVRKLLIDMNAVDILIDLFDRYSPVGDYCLCTSLLSVLSRIIKGRSESVGEKHIQKLINSLSKLIDELEANASTDLKFSLIAAIYSVLHLSCTKNERNRTSISQTQTVTRTINFFVKIVELFDNLPFNTFYPALKEGCGFLRSLTLDDDLDVEFGLGSENARTIAKSDSCLEVFVKLISKKFYKEAASLLNIFSLYYLKMPIQC
ncbi:ARMC6-like protein [Schistosoma mansoni]|uniref:ARMC6-like protein n=1 Tax=Schistosoma mansoni TaxID=6183 RepID=UPI0001A64323|nr:ARMC6-like protein [Schistosoma mansoni]|eukprot:XP_018652182.1 ARMC6-like protein [Schistosoma mansoni]